MVKRVWWTDKGRDSKNEKQEKETKYTVWPL